MAHLNLDTERLVKTDSLKINRENYLKKKRGFDRNLAELPTLVRQCCDWIQKYGLKEEGIFRIPGDQTHIKELRSKFDKGETVTLSEHSDPHDVAGVLKLFVAEPKESLLTFELYDLFIEAGAVDDLDSRIDHIRIALQQLPQGNMFILRRLFNLLKMVTEPENLQVNKMTVMNLTMVFTPALVRKRKQTMASMVEDGKWSSRLVETCIQHYAEVFRNGPSKSRLQPSFEKSLNVGQMKIMTTELQETQQREDIQEVAKMKQIPEDLVSVKMLDEFYKEMLAEKQSHEVKQTVWHDVLMDNTSDTSSDQGTPQQTPLEPDDTMSNIMELANQLNVSLDHDQNKQPSATSPAPKRKNTSYDVLKLMTKMTKVSQTPIDPTQRNQMTELEKVLRDVFLRRVYRRFLEGTNNSKLLAFWKDVEEFSVNRKRLEGKPLIEEAQKIFDEHLGNNGWQVLKLEKTHLDNVSQLLSNPDPSMYDDTKLAVMQTLAKETIPGFLASQMYREYKEETENAVQKQLLELAKRVMASKQKKK